MGAAEAEMRIWTSVDGKTVTAGLVDATDTTVTIKNEAGKEFTLAHERLSEADREVIAAFLAKKRAEEASIEWPEANPERAVKASHFKKLHSLDAKKHTQRYAGRILALSGTVLEVKADKMSAAQGVIVVLDTGDKVPVEFSFPKSSYEKDLPRLGADVYGRYRGPWGEDEFRATVADGSLVVERRYVTSQESDYNYSTGNYRYRKKWSSWEVVSKPVARGETMTLRGEFVSVFNSVMSFKDAHVVETAGSTTTTRAPRY